MQMNVDANGGNMFFGFTICIFIIIPPILMVIETGINVTLKHSGGARV